jgi:hypothetical protein
MAIPTKSMAKSTLRSNALSSKYATPMTHHRHRHRHPDSNVRVTTWSGLQILSDVHRYQTCPFPIAYDNPAFSLLSQLPSLAQDELYHLSLEREPRGCELKQLLAQS